MGLFEYNHIETLIGKDTPLWLTLIIAVSGVIVGFCLSEYAAWKRKIRQIKFVGKTFEFEINALKEPLKKQIEALEILKEAVKKHERINPSIYFYKNLVFIKSLDRLLVVSYYKMKKGDESYKTIRDIYNALSCIEIEIDRFMEFYNEFNENLSKNYLLFQDTLNSFTRSVLMVKKINEDIPDLYISNLFNLFKENVTKEGGEISNILHYREPFLLDISKLNLNNAKHPYFVHSQIYTQNCYDIISRVVKDSESLVFNTEIIKKSLIDNYEKIYKEKL